MTPKLIFNNYYNIPIRKNVYEQEFKVHFFAYKL